VRGERGEGTVSTSRHRGESLLTYRVARLIVPAPINTNPTVLPALVDSDSRVPQTQQRLAPIVPNSVVGVQGVDYCSHPLEWNATVSESAHGAWCLGRGSPASRVPHLLGDSCVQESVPGPPAHRWRRSRVGLGPRYDYWRQQTPQHYEHGVVEDENGWPHNKLRRN
jgi:hypothetical protein